MARACSHLQTHTTWVISHSIESVADFLMMSFSPLLPLMQQEWKNSLCQPTLSLELAIWLSYGHWGKEKSAIMFLKSFTDKKTDLRHASLPSFSCLKYRHLSKTCPSCEGNVRNVNGLKVSVLTFVTLSALLSDLPKSDILKPLSQYQKLPTSNLTAVGEKEVPS